MKFLIFQLLVVIELSLSLAPHEIAILILSQQDTYHAELAYHLQSEIYNQSALIDKDHLVNVYLSHETIDHPGDWTFLAILPELATKRIIDTHTKWIVLCEDQSSINLSVLINGLAGEDHTKEKYLGYPVYDQEATIVHHFAFFENPQWFPYPLIRSGVAFTIPIIRRLTKRVQEEKPTTDFFIDASHELSLFIWQNMRIENNKLESEAAEAKVKQGKDAEEKLIGLRISENGDRATATHGDSQDTKLYKQNGRKLLLVASPYLCPAKGNGCAVYPRPRLPSSTSTCKPIRPETIYFAIKTCQKFHKERIPTIKRTWGQHAIHKKFYSDIEDDSIPTKSTGIPNTDTGHCGKTLSILKLALQDIKEMNRSLKRHIEWVFLSDDDTLLSVTRICDILGCFNSKDEIYLGERYGYRLHSKDGFNYITGGGGIAFSIPTVHKIVDTCTCPAISSPDDMIIGICLQRQGIRAIHSSRFHQARPPDYPYELLLVEPPVSFHKFWQIDPMLMYDKWFKEADNNCNALESSNNCDINTSGQSTKIAKNLSNGSGNQRNLRKSNREHFDL